MRSVAAVGVLFSCLAVRAVAGPASDYLGEAPPGDEPVIFGRGTVSIDGKNTHALRFSPDGDRLVFSRYPDRTSYRMVRTTSGWTAPEETAFSGKEVAFDAGSRRIFFYDSAGDLLWVRDGEGLQLPTRLGARINTPEAEYYPSLSASGRLYFSRNSRWDQARLLRADPEGEDFASPVDLGEVVNGGGASHGSVAPDESYLLFNSPRPGSHTQNDIWVSYRQADGSWGAPINLGPRINRGGVAVLCPTVSPDGRYLFFTRLQQDRTGYVYWVSSAILERLRGTRREEVR